MHTPFFPQWRPRLAALGARVQHLRTQSLLQLEGLFGHRVPAGLLSQAEEKANSRDRVYTVRRTFWGFLYQVLNPDCSCRQIVRQIQAFFRLHEMGSVNPGTSAYCQARGRLPWDSLPRLRCAVAAQAEKLLPQVQQHWFGLRPKVIDGTTITLADTPKNQRAYPQPHSQKPGCGFPLLKLVGIFSLASGVLLDYAKGNQHQSEQALLHKLLDHFKPTDLALADRGFSSYTLIALLLLQKVNSLFRLHQGRSTDLRQGKRLGQNDRRLTWCKPNAKPPYVPQSLWKLVPKELSVRVLRFSLQVRGFRSQSVTLVTTLLDPKTYPAQELARLYARRWRIELWFRHLKTSLGMESLRCQSPQMVHKELEMFWIAYNLIRALMTEASALYQVPVERISFKGTVDALRQFCIALAQARSKKKQRQLVAQLQEVLALDPVPQRPGRREPRALKRRPKPFALLTKHRRQFKEIPHKNRYTKSHPSKTTT